MPPSNDPSTADPPRARGAGAVSSSRTGGIRLGSVAGVEISVDYSWFVLLFLILGTLTGAVFPSQVRGLDQVTYILMGVAGTVLFFASLLGHELSHSLVARAKGIEVHGITLFIFGGMAKTRSEATSPGDELQIAGVGPLSSLVFAFLFYGLEWLGFQLGWSRAVIGVAWYLGLVNLALALFNLLPGFPLDGGRLLRAILWRSMNDLRRATRAATTSGRWMGYAIVALGIYSLFFTGDLIGGLWFVFIGWFLSNAATASYQQLMLRQVMGEVTAADAMTRNPETVGPDPTLAELVHEHFFKRPYNAFPVVEDGVPIGMVTLSQVKAVPKDDWELRRVADIMTPLEETLIVEPDSPMSEVLQQMSENETRRVLVAREWELLGIVTSNDVANWLDRAGMLGG